MTIQVSSALLEDVRRYGDFQASACMNCGGCTAVCPLGIEVLPGRSSATSCSAWRRSCTGRPRRSSPACSADCARRPAVAQRRRISPRTSARCARTWARRSSDSDGPSDRRRHRHPLRQPALARLGAADSEEGRERLGTGARSAQGRQDRALQRSDDPAHPLYRGTGEMGGAPRRLLPGSLYADRPLHEPLPQSERFHGPARPSAPERPTTGFSPTSPACSSARAWSSATSTRTTSTPAP